MIFTETKRLILKDLTEDDLPHLVELLGEWEVVKWMAMTPHPYYLSDAQSFLQLHNPQYRSEKPSFFAITDKQNIFMGGIEIHTVTSSTPQDDTLEIGYWLGSPFWNQGFMTEALTAALPLAFKNNSIQRLIAYTNPVNEPSQNTLKKTGFSYLGIHPREKPGRYRGSQEVSFWELTRKNFEQKKPAHE